MLFVRKLQSGDFIFDYVPESVHEAFREPLAPAVYETVFGRYGGEEFEYTHLHGKFVEVIVKYGTNHGCRLRCVWGYMINIGLFNRLPYLLILLISTGCSLFSDNLVHWFNMYCPARSKKYTIKR
jgi:hypothetical protein